MSYGIKDILHNKVKDLLHLETTPGLGCTEPAAIGLAAAAAASMLDTREFDAITVETDPNIYKNAMGVVIPNSEGGNGITLAAAMGAASGDADRGLEVFAPVEKEGLARAKELLAQGKVRAGIAEDTHGLHVKVVIAAGPHTAEAVIEGAHDRIVSRVLDGERQDTASDTSGPAGSDSISGLEEWLVGLTLTDLVDILSDLDSDDLEYIRSGLNMNNALADYGLAHGPGIGVGRTQLSLLRQGLLKKDASLWAAIRAGAGIDARMGGVALPAMTLGGSGNQGIAAGVPVAAASEFTVLEDETILLEAVTLSYLVTCSIKVGAGRLSALCGSGVAGGAGVAAATTHLLGGTVEKVGWAVKNHIENTTPVICDGAKTSCALKVGEMVGSAVKSAFLALAGCVVRPTDGIVDLTPELTMRHVGRIAREGMAGMDPVILDIMLHKCL